ncbi:MAG: hypothetical protein JWS10_143 [Cypionkella sp.]|nr:hypothetical protein [Cypionkella sp.]
MRLKRQKFLSAASLSEAMDCCILLHSRKSLFEVCIFGARFCCLSGSFGSRRVLVSRFVLRHVGLSLDVD